MTGEVHVPLESHPATVVTASAAKDDDITEYEAGFRLVEQYNIVSVSGLNKHFFHSIYLPTSDCPFLPSLPPPHRM